MVASPGEKAWVAPPDPASNLHRRGHREGGGDGEIAPDGSEGANAEAAVDPPSPRRAYRTALDILGGSSACTARERLPLGRLYLCCLLFRLANALVVGT